MRRTILKGMVASLALASVGGIASGAFAEDAAAFYKGKSITWIVPYNPGGGYDEYSRMIAPYMAKYTGARIDLKNMPGAGGLKGANEIYNSPADGLTIGIINGSAMVTNQLAGEKGANYKISKYSYLGRFTADRRVLSVGTNSGIKTFKDMENSKKPVVMGATGLGGSTYVDAVLVDPAFGIQQKLIHGFNNSSDVRQAILRGEVQGMWGSLGSALQPMQDGDQRIVVQSGNKPDARIPDVPTVMTLAKDLPDTSKVMPVLKAWEALNAVGRPVAGPPDIPADRLAFLQEAFKKAMNDPEFQAKMKANDRSLVYASGDEMVQIAKDATEMSDSVQQKIVSAIKGKS